VERTDWIDQKEQLTEKYGERFRHVITNIKNGLAQDQLSNINIATKHLHDNPGTAAAVVARLNNLVRQSPLSFRWYPAHHNQSGKLLIRNQSVGLVIKTEPNSTPEGIMLNPENGAPYCPLAPETALSVLSSQARKHIAVTARTAHLKSSHRLRALPSLNNPSLS
jgi:hypothetical protein